MDKAHHNSSKYAALIKHEGFKLLILNDTKQLFKYIYKSGISFNIMAYFRSMSALWLNGS